MEKLNVLVMFGGNSLEKDVSIITAIQVINALDSEKYNIVPIFLTEDYRFLMNDDFKKIETFKNEIKGKEVVFQRINNKLYLKTNNLIKRKKEVDFVILAVHGKGIEDGTLVGFLETLGATHSAEALLTSSIFQNKYYTKVILDKMKIDNMETIYIKEKEWINDSSNCLKKINEFTYPLIVKACNLGSSIGVFKVKKEEDLYWALNTVFKYDKELIVEKCLENYREFNQAIIGSKVSEIEEIVGAKDFLTFSDKYLNNDTKRIHPAKISKELEDLITSTTIKIANEFEKRGVIRIDYLYDKTLEKLYVNEINTIPGSLAYYLFSDLTFSELLDKLIQDGIKNKYLDKLKISNFKSNILKNLNGFKNNK